MFTDIEIEKEEENFKFRTNGILLFNNKVLSVRMEKNCFYCLPGGHVTIGEDSETAIIREMKEETGYNVNIEKLIAITENFFTRKNGKKIHELSFYYLLSLKEMIKIKQDEKDIIEIEQGEKIEHHFKWIDLAEIKKIDVRPVCIYQKLQQKNYDFESIIIT